LEPEEFLKKVKAAVDGLEQKVKWNVVERQGILKVVNHHCHGGAHSEGV
jgi:hypothetical protein